MNSFVTARRRELWWIALFTLAAFALRLIDLTARSLWLDEGFTLARVFGPWADLLRNAVTYDGVVSIDTQPQVYFALLKLWIGPAGVSEFALRLFSALAGVLCVPLIYVLARRTLSGRAGVIAAALMTLSPLMQWYGHEVRMYSLVVCLSALSIYWLRRMLLDVDTTPRGRVGMGLAWLAASAAAALTHYSFVGVLAAEAAAIVIAIVRRPRWRAAVRHHALAIGALVAVAAVAALALAALVDLPFLLRRLLGGAESTYSFVPLHTIVQSILSGVLFGMNAVDPVGGLLTWLAAGVCALGAWLWWRGRPRKRADVALLLACAFVPVLTWFALSFIKPNYHGVRHLIVVLPAVAALLAGAVDILLGPPLAFGGAQSEDRSRPGATTARVGGLALLVVLLGAQLYGLLYTFVRTPDWQDDWRGLASYVRERWQPGDAALETAGTPERIPELYLGDLPLQTARLSTFAGLTPEEAAQAISAQHPRVWFINTGGRDIAEGEAGPYLGSFHVRERVRFPGRTNTLEVALLETRSPVSSSLPASASVVAGGEGLPARLAAFELLPGNEHARRPNLRLALYWQRAGADAEVADLRTSLVLRHGDATWWDWTVPVALTAAPESWAPGAYFRTEHLVPLPLGLPALLYDLNLIVRGQAKDDPLQQHTSGLSSEQVACCARVSAWPGGADATAWRTSDAELVAAEFPGALRPGETLPVALTWRKTAADAAQWATQLTLSGVVGSGSAGALSPAGEDTFNVAQWPLGEAVRDLHALQVPYSWPPGLYRLTLDRMRDGARVDGVDLGWVRIEDYPRTPVAASIQHPADAQVGDMGLLGYSLDAPVERGVPLDFVTHWRVNQAPQRDGVLFLHVVDANGEMVSQDDNPPERGKRSTLTYRPGDGIDQIHRIVLEPELPAGKYRLLAGVYDREGAARWPAQQNGQPAPNDLVELGTITLP